MVPAVDKQRDPLAPLPDPPGPKRTGRMVLLGAVGLLVSLGAGALGMSMYVGSQAQGFELTLQFGPRTTHVLGTNVTLSEGENETKCVLSLLDFRALREQTLFLADVPETEKPPRGLPRFELALMSGEQQGITRGALPQDQLEPIDHFVISHASACIRTFVPKGPTPVR
jgi:hypothetical protein